jgi:urea transport system ATP-binding protein
LLILDEPTEGIQPSIIKDIERAIRVVASSKPNLDQAKKNAERQEVMEAIQKVAATGEVAILLVEQYYDFARALADQYLVMERGEIIKRGAGTDMDKDGVRELLSV